MSRFPRCAPTSEQGFSLIELFIVMALLGVFVVGIYETVIAGLRAVDDADDRAGVRHQLASALDRFTREARMAEAVDTARVDDFQFDADFDGSGGSTGTEDNITFRLNSTTFERKQGSNAAVPLVTGVTSLTFDYRDLNDTDLTPPVTGSSDRANIRIVQVTITATRGDETITMDQAAYLGNM